MRLVVVECPAEVCSWDRVHLALQRHPLAWRRCWWSQNGHIMWAVCAQQRWTTKLHTQSETLSWRDQSTGLTVDGQVVGRRHAADWVADPALVAAMVGAVDGLHRHGLIACREFCSVVCSEEPAALRPFSCNDGAWGHAAQVGGAQAFNQDGCRALDDGSSYRRWGGQVNTRVSIKQTHSEGQKQGRVELNLLNSAEMYRKKKSSTLINLWNQKKGNKCFRSSDNIRVLNMSVFFFFF